MTPSCLDCWDTGTTDACELEPGLHDPADSLACDQTVPCPCRSEENP